MVAKKKPSVSVLKKRLDRVFSEYVRRKAVAEVSNEYIVCCSCGQVGHWKNMDEGHFVNRRHNATRYDERNVHPQCRECNRYDEGNAVGYSRYLIDKYGREVLVELDHLGHQVKKFTPDDLLGLIAEYREKLRQLEARP